MKKVRDIDTLSKIVKIKLNNTDTRKGSPTFKIISYCTNLDTKTDLNKLNDTVSINTLGNHIESTNNLNYSIASKSNLDRFESRLKKSELNRSKKACSTEFS